MTVTVDLTTTEKQNTPSLDENVNRIVDGTEISDKEDNNKNSVIPDPPNTN